MKRAVRISWYLLFSLVVIVPLGVRLSDRFGYRFELANDSVFAIVTALLSVCAVVLSIAGKENVESKIAGVLFVLLTPLSLMNVVCCLFVCCGIWAIISVLICAVCCCCLSIIYGKPLAFKIIALGFCAFMAMPIGLLSVIALTFGNIGQNTVVCSVESPNGTYYAEVIDSDQGALGGDTFVDVYENKEFNALIFKSSKRPQRVYRGEWGEFEDMRIYWKDDHCLMINAVEYEIE